MNAIQKMQQEGTLKNFTRRIDTGLIKEYCPTDYGLDKQKRCSAGECADCWEHALTKDYEGVKD